MPAKWNRLDNVPQQTGQMQAVRAKKHVTVFIRSSSAPGAGSPEVKAAFKVCAAQTLGIEDRLQRNATMKTCMQGKGTGVYHRKSRARPGSPLFGKVYTMQANRG